MSGKSYKQIKSSVLEVYFEACRTMGIELGQPHEQAIGYVVYNCQHAFTEAVEDIMFHCVLLILSGGWHKQLESTLRDDLLNKVQACGLNNILAGMNAQDAESFKLDANALGIFGV